MLAHMHPSSRPFAIRFSPCLRARGTPARSPGLAQDRQVPRAALPAAGVTMDRSESSSLSEGVTPPSSLIPAHAPDQNPPFASLCGLVRTVFAGCCQSLLGVGPSRRYLHSLCEGAWTHTPPRSSGACTRFFPEDIGLALLGRSSARETSLALQFLTRELPFEAAVIR